MNTDYHHGVRIIEITEDTRPIRTVNTAIIGIVATADDADTSVFPLDSAIRITDIQSVLGKAGTQGTLASTLEAIYHQANAICIVVRVAEGDDEDTMNAHVIGDIKNGKRTGMQALLSAKTHLGITPRILGAPGLDTQKVAQELIKIAQSVRGFVYLSAGHATTKEEVIAYRQTFNAREAMIIWPDFTRWNSQTHQADSVSAVARALGVRAKTDHDIGWHKTLSNTIVNGVTGISDDVSWDLQSPTTDAGVLNAKDITTLINHNGFRFWGSRTCSDNTNFAFENYTRTAQILADTMAEAHLWAIDKPMHAYLVKDVVEGVNAKLRSMVSQGYLLGGECWFNDTHNNSETLKTGRLTLDYDYMPVPPVENLLLRQSISDRYVLNFNRSVQAA